MSDYSHHSDATAPKKAFLTRGLAALAISHLTDTPIEELAKYVTDGSQDGGIDLIYFDSSESTLYLVQTKWHDDGHGSIDLGDALKFIEGVRKVLDNNLGQLNSRIQARKSDIERALYDANAKFILVVAHTGQENLNIEVSTPLTNYIDDQNDTSELMFLRVLNQSDLHKSVAAGLTGAPISIEVQLTAWGQIREPHYAIYGQVCATDIAAWFQTNGNRLFESNLRQFLMGTNVNQDIVETLIDRPADFWYFNNGITAISNNIGKKPIGGNSTDSGIFECTGFSVVNGAQTVGAIYAAFQKKPASVAMAMVPVRIISNAESPAVFSSEVTRCTNTQNAIEKRDFVALDPEQERIRQELHIEGVEYAYKAGSGTGSSGKRFDLTEATIALACGFPDIALAIQAKREISKLWEDIGKAPYKQLFNSSTQGPTVFEHVQSLRVVELILQTETLKYSGRDALICVHGNRFIEWVALRSIAATKKSNPLDVLEVTEIVKKTITQTLSSVRTQYSDSYPASLFKNLKKCRALAEVFVKSAAPNK